MEVGGKARCPKCGGPLRPRRGTLGATDDAVWACIPCGLYGVEGDDRMLNRVDSRDDDEFQARLLKRAAGLKDWVAERKARYTDVPDGRIFGR